MDAVQPVPAPVSSAGLQYLDRLFDAVKKTTVIELRWPLVISSAYLLLYAPALWLTPIQIQALLIFYLLTNVTLYFVADEYVESPYFYGPLLVFDTVFLGIVLVVSGGGNASFYVACCLTLVLSCICNDSRGLLVVTILAPLLYGYTVFNSGGTHDPSTYLRVLFPLVIAIFYGYFAQVERLKRVAQENEQRAWRERQAAEEIRRQANELRRANRVKDEFLGVVSHELKTPLNVISGYTHILLEDMLGVVSPTQEKALQTIAHQSKELNDLINRVLQVSSIEAHTVQAEFHEVNFWELLAELRHFYDYPLGKDVKLLWEFPPDLPTLLTDRNKLKHILQNLINNAIKFTEKGSVAISAQYSATEKWMEFKVADTGIGIPADQLPLIFERFRQLDASETRLYSGVGLGLYIASQYTALLGGTIQVDSKLGQGTVFTLRIPCKAKETEALTEQLSLLAAAQKA